MADKKLLNKLPNVPLAQPGFDTFTMSVPTIIQMSPDGKWENKKPDKLNEQGLKSVIQHLVNSKAINAAQSYCHQCQQENKLPGVKFDKNYVPVVVMPIYTPENCPFDIDCEATKIHDAEKPKQMQKLENQAKQSGGGKDGATAKKKKRGYVLQRLTDFDLMSQW